jgi:4-amino-4-deoxy-L-arabinose transferase-like glycosyltransferase
VVGAAALRFVMLSKVPLNPFYEAALRSMSLNGHNLFYGAFDPLGLSSIDKPPLHLWLQTGSVALFGHHHISSLLPQAVLGTLAVPLLYDTIRRPFGRPAGLAAALFLAILPLSVVTARSDTMDSSLMFLLIAATWMVVRSLEGRTGYFYGAMVILGLAFNVKLFQALLPVPALAAMYLYGGQGTLRRRAGHLVAGGLLFAGVAFSWVIAASIGPGHHPWPIGANRPSIWNAIFVFDGSARASSGSAPALDRLFSAQGPERLGQLVGIELLGALVIGLLAAGVALALHRGPRDRARIAIAGGFGIWLLTGTVFFTHNHQMHARYLESFSPAIAGVLGVAIVWLARGLLSRRWVVVPFSIGVVATAGYAAGLPGFGLRQSVFLAPAALAAVVFAVLGARAAHRGASGRLARIAVPVATACAIGAIGVGSVASAVNVVSAHRQTSGQFGRLHFGAVDSLSRFLLGHRGHARYELAVDVSANASSLIARDGLPVLPLTVWGSRPFVSVGALRSQVVAGNVRYLYLEYPCGFTRATQRCVPAARWAVAHGTDVTKQAGLHHPSRLYALSRASALRVRPL